MKNSINDKIFIGARSFSEVFMLINAAYAVHGNIKNTWLELYK